MSTRELVALVAAQIQAQRCPGVEQAVKEALTIVEEVDRQTIGELEADDLPFVGAPVRGDDPFAYERDTCRLDPDGYPEDSAA